MIMACACNVNGSDLPFLNITENGIHGIIILFRPICSLFYTDVK